MSEENNPQFGMDPAPERRGRSDMWTRNDPDLMKHCYHKFVQHELDRMQTGCVLCGFGSGALQHDMAMAAGDPNGEKLMAVVVAAVRYQ